MGPGMCPGRAIWDQLRPSVEGRAPSEEWVMGGSAAGQGGSPLDGTFAVELHPLCAETQAGDEKRQLEARGRGAFLGFPCGF